MQGESLLPILIGENSKWTRDAVYYHYYEYPAVHMVKRHYAIVTKEYKLVHYYFDVDEWELIDRIKDPNELKNVYNDPAYAEIRKDLHARLEQLRGKYGDSSELSQSFIDRYLDDIAKSRAWGANQQTIKKIFEKTGRKAAYDFE
jgi:arylsulfatase A-like enzyme